MKKGKIYLILIGVILLIMIIIGAMNIEVKSTGETTTEITPGEEMTEQQERQTIIALYYTNIENNTLLPEARVIDAKELLEEPYKTLVEYLIKAPKNDKLKSSLPQNTSVISAALEGDTVILNLSKDFIEGEGINADTIKLSIYSVVNTLTELNEVNAVKILIDGEENKEVEGIKFSESFRRME